MFLGWVVVLIVDECVALSLGEFASKYPTSAGPYYWSFQLASPSVRTVLSFITGTSSLAQIDMRAERLLKCASVIVIVSCFADNRRARLDMADRQLDDHSKCELWVRLTNCCDGCALPPGLDARTIPATTDILRDLLTHLRHRRLWEQAASNG